tara:strand:- start:41 stop:1336 length:1296 start_codon:yes stop_codon:yes gene_type:complete
MTQVSQEISKESILKVSRELEFHHAIFYKLWEMGTPILNKNIETAQVCFDRRGELVSFEFGPDLWFSLTDHERAFVIAHECLHVILNHGKRISNLDKKEEEMANIAMDVAVNEMLLGSFGFKLNKLNNCPKLCLCDTVFKGKNISKNRPFEYYLDQLRKNPNKMPTLDSHEFLSSINKEILEQISESLSNDTSISKEEIKNFLKAISSDTEEGDEDNCDAIDSNGKKAGSIAGKLWKKLHKKKPKTDKKKWLELVSNLSRSILKQGSRIDEQWLMKPRRMSAINSNFFLPFEHEEVSYDQNKFNSWFFLDCSGSCYEYASKFFNATRAVPEEHFNTKIFTFDMQVKEINKNDDAICGFGGTSFACIEKYIQSQIINNKIKYPDLVFVLTDGYGDNPNPQLPKRWIWINITDYDRCIPKESVIVKYENLIFE